MEKKKRKQGDFVVQIQSCKNSTWQGSVMWLDDHSKENFRSLLELIRLIDSALDDTE